VIVGVGESLILLVNSHISQNDRDVETKCGVLVIEEPRKLSHWALSNGNNRFFGYPRAIVYDVVAKYTTVQRSMPARKSHSKERIARTLLKGLSADGPAQLLRKLASIVGVSEPNASNCQGGPSIQITTQQRYNRCSLMLPGQAELLASTPNNPDLNPFVYYV